MVKSYLLITLIKCLTLKSQNKRHCGELQAGQLKTSEKSFNFVKYHIGHFKLLVCVGMYVRTVPCMRVLARLPKLTVSFI